jgi:hypothetical protein
MDDHHQDASPPPTARPQGLLRRLLRLLADERALGVALCGFGLIALPFTTDGGGVMLIIGAWVLIAEHVKYEEPLGSGE